MPRDVAVPQLGESIAEGTLARWLKPNGDFVREGEPLFELETDKATAEVPSPATGRLQWLAKEGDTVAVGAVVARIEEDGSAAVAPAPAGRREPESKRPAEPAAVASPAPAPAAEPPEPAAPPVPPPPSRPAFSTVGESRQPMSRLRKTIAERLLAAQKTAAILSTFNECDMSRIMTLRHHHRNDFQERHGVGLGMMSFFIKAVVEALKAFPILHARIDGEDIVYPGGYHIGVAVITDRGLMVPVIRHADRLSFAELEKAVAGFAEQARTGKIAVDDLRGGSFTITNGGVFGSLLSTPLLNPPQSAILGMHAIKDRPVAVAGQVVIRPMMYLALSYDHRLIDGREAVLFLAKVKELVEDPLRLLVGI